MSQEQLSIEPTDKKTSADAKTAKAKPPMEAQKKSPLIVIIAIVVVLALIGTAFAVMMMGNVTAQKPGLKVILTPSSISMPNGSQVRIFAFVYFLNNTDDEITDSTKNISNSVACAVTVKWQEDEDELGEIIAGRAGTARYWQLNSLTEGESAINWSFKYRDPDTHLDFWLNKTLPVTISVAELDYISLSPPSTMMLKNTAQMFTAEAYLTNGILVNATFTWALDNSSIGTISDATGPSTNFTAGSVNATGNLICNGTYQSKTVSSTAPIQVITVLPESETNARVYDLFNVTLQDFWNDRYQETVLSPTYPVSYVWLGTPSGNNWIYTDFRMNVTAKNISKANTSVNPVYLPITNPNPMVRGGNIKIDWVADYLTKAEELGRGYGGQIDIWYDSWYYEMNGTVTMDKVAAKMVLNMTDADFRNFDDWKTQNFNAFKNKLSQWLLYEMNTRVAIRFAYEWDGNTLFEKYDVKKVGDEIVLVFEDYLSWGMESLLGRWWRDTFLPGFEGWPEETHFTANIGPLWSDFNLESVMQYSMLAKTSTRGNQSCWVFEDTHADAVAGDAFKQVNGKWVNYSSEMNPYTTTPGYWNFLVSNAFYGTVSPYDYTPWAWNLGPKDSWAIEWPSATNVLGYKDAGLNVYTDTVTGHVDPLWIEPIPGEIPSVMTINKTGRTITMKGPFDGTQWSKNSNGAKEVKENWSTVGLLPRGVPYMEFIINSVTSHPPVASLAVPQLVGVNSTITLASGSYDIDGTIAKYEWGFDDSLQPGHINTTVPYKTHAWNVSEGWHLVTLKVTDDDGNTASDSTWVHAVYNMPPTASFTFGDSVVAMQVPASMDASASSDSDGTIVNYDWEFGDGTTASGASSKVTHLYSAMKTYRVNLTVIDDKGGSASISKFLGIQTDLCAKIVMPDTVAAGNVASLTGERSFSFNGSRTIVNYTWDFGDGTALGYGKNVTHTWATAGTYVVNLVVKDSGGYISPNATGRITIGDSAIVGLSVGLSRHSLFLGESATLTVTAVDGAGKKVSTSSLVDVSVNGSGSWTGLPNVGLALVAGTASFAVSCSDEGSYNITAIIQGSPSISGSEFATVANTTIEMRIYDFMQVPLGNDFGSKVYRNYWNPVFRGKWGDDVFRYEAPAYHIFASGSNVLQSNIDTTYRINVEARNVTGINLSSDPTFFPRKNSMAGGTVSFTWDYHYMNEDEFWFYNFKNKPPLQTKQYVNINWTWNQYDKTIYGYPAFYMYNQADSYYDGWETIQDINLTMDRSAAYQMIGLPTNETNVAHWWIYYEYDPIGDMYVRHGNNDTVQTYWDTFMVNEGGGGSTPGRLDIRSGDDGYPWQGGFLNSYYRLWDNGDGTVSLHVWHYGYGEDVLLARWLYWGGVKNGWNYPNGTPKGIIPFEPYYDDFHMSGEIDSDSANISLDTGVVYGFRAQKSKDPSVPAETAVWRWEQIRMDYWNSASAGGNRSEMDLWADNSRTFEVWDPAGTEFGLNISADQSPNVLYLDLGESLIMEKPRTLVSGMMQYPLAGDPTQTGSRQAAGFYDWMRIIEKWGNATIHPLGCPVVNDPSSGGRVPTSIIDKGTGDLVIVGPFWPIVSYYPDMPWLHTDSAPLIEYWIA